MKTTVSREGIYYLFIVIAIFTGAFLREVNPMLLFALLLFAPIPIARHLGRKTLKKMSVKRIVPERVFAGEPFTIGIEVSNARPAGFFSLSSWGIVVIDRLRRLTHSSHPPAAAMRPRSPFYEPAVYFSYIPNGQTVYQSYSGCLPLRGEYRFEQVQISTLFPFGFFRNRVDLPAGGENVFYVYPPIGTLSNQWRQRQQETNENLQRTHVRPIRQTGDFFGVRSWQSGDSKRDIHWRAFARYQAPVVRQYELNQNRDYAVILDLFGGSKTEGKGGADSLLPVSADNFELAVSFTATLVTDWIKFGGGTLFFAANDRSKPIVAPLNYALLNDILQRLASASVSGHDYLREILLAIPPQICSEIIFVTLSGSDGLSSRLSALSEDSRLSDTLRRLRIVDVSSSEFDEFFTIYTSFTEPE